MLTPQELLQSLAVPAVVSTILAALGWWRRWPWAMPHAAAVGFLTAYAIREVPRLPPLNGHDWLFWTTIPLALVGVLDAALPRRWGPILGAAAGVVAFVIIKPLAPSAVSFATLAGAAAIFAIAGVVLALVAQTAESRVNAATVAAALSITLAGAGVTAFSSGFRVMGIHGLAAAAAMGPLIIFSACVNAARPLAILNTGLLAGLLAAAHFYADPGIPWTKASILLAAPALLMIGALLPTHRMWLRATAALLAVTIAVGAVAAPAALAAKKAAESPDPYADYYK